MFESVVKNVENYSSDILTKAAFENELRNRLLLIPEQFRNKEWITVVKYFEERVENLNSIHKNKK